MRNSAPVVAAEPDISTVCRFPVILDANALIRGDINYIRSLGADDVITLPAILAEVRDKVSREMLASWPVKPNEMSPDAASIDLSEAPRIICGGAGIQTSSSFHTLFDIADELGASVGATRVITDRSWVEHQRQIGTTGVVVNPQLYIALGVSGAVQHTSGLGQPEHIVSINTDPHCPMMQLADLGIVSDANEVLPALLAALQKRKSNV